MMPSGASWCSRSAASSWENIQVLPIIRLRNAYVTRQGLTIVPRLDLFITAMQITATP
jgi:hypothetical protein